MNRLKLLFWNVGSGSAVDLISDLVRDHEPDVVILAEAKLPDAVLVQRLNSGTVARYHLPVNRSERLKFFVSMSPQRFESVYDGPGIAIRRVKAVLSEDLTLVALHLSSKLHLASDDQSLLVTRAVRRVVEAEARVGHDRTVVIGDFNMNPFEAGLGNLCTSSQPGCCGKRDVG